MDSNSMSGSLKRSPCDSQLDFIEHWADRTVEEAILEGVQLRQQKPHPLSGRDYDTIKSDYIKPTCRRKKPRKKYKGFKSRSNSPHRRADSPPRSSKTAKKRKCKATCGMRTAELAVPTKRHCLETWRNKSHTLPAFMIERLRHLVTDQKPVVQIADAFTCFSKKNKKGRMTKRSASNHACKCCNKNKKLFRTSELKTLTAIFGHKIGKMLNTPINITLNPDLVKIARVVYHDIGVLVCRSKKINMHDDFNNSIHKEITDKITIWISDVLDESNRNYLEEQIKDFEDEAGPVLDFLDDLIDGVLDICVPEPEVIAEFDVLIGAGDEHTGLEEESEDDSSGNLDRDEITQQEDEKIEQDEENTEQEDENTEQDDENTEIGDENIDQDDENIENVDKNVDKHERNNDVPVDYIDEHNEDIHMDADAKSDENLNMDEGQNLQPSEEAKGEDINIEEHESRVDADWEANENAENNEMNNDEYLDFEQKAPETNENLLQSVHGIEKKSGEEADIPSENTDNNIETFTDAIEDNKEPSEVSTDENDKTVKFTDVNKEEDAKHHKKGIAQEADVSWKASLEHISFAPPNEDLLSNADESWPEEYHASALKPSQSVSKSITSLGNIKEDEERSSIIPNETASVPGQQIDNNNKSADKRGQINDEHTRGLTKQRTTGKETKKDHKFDKKLITPVKNKAGKLGKPGHLPGTQKVNSKSKKDKVKPETTHVETKATKDHQKTLKAKIPIIPKITIVTTPPSKPKMKNGGGKRKLKEQPQDKTTLNVIDLQCDLDSVENFKDIHFLTSKAKSKTDKYKVDSQTAPAWVSRDFGVSACSIGKSKAKGLLLESCLDNDLKRWCWELEKGYENLIIWNEWIENTGRTVCMLQQEINKTKIRDTGCLDCPVRCTKKEWKRLKRYIDSDAALWKILKQNTQEKMKSYRKLYQNRSENQVTIKCDCPPPK